MALLCQGYNTSSFKGCKLSKEERISVDAIHNIICDQIQDVLVSFNPVLVTAVNRLFSDWTAAAAPPSPVTSEPDIVISPNAQDVLTDYKGQLIQLMIKLNEDPPVFVVESRKHKFIASVRFMINKTRFQLEGDLESKRKSAERSAAAKALARIANETAGGPIKGSAADSSADDKPSVSDVKSKKSSKAEIGGAMPASVARKGAPQNI